MGGAHHPHHRYHWHHLRHRHHWLDWHQHHFAHQTGCKRTSGNLLQRVLPPRRPLQRHLGELPIHEEDHGEHCCWEVGSVIKFWQLLINSIVIITPLSSPSTLPLQSWPSQRAVPDSKGKHATAWTSGKNFLKSLIGKNFLIGQNLNILNF